MVWTTITDNTAEDICLNPHESTCVHGTLGENAYPGQVVVKDESAGVWMLMDTDDSAITKYNRCGVVGYEKRVNGSTMALKLITDVYVYNCAGDKIVPIWTDGVVICYIDDTNADLPPGHEFIASSTAGSMKKQQLQTVSGGTTTLLALIQSVIGVSATRIADGDTFAVMGIGRHMGKIWGGINTVGS